MRKILYLLAFLILVSTPVSAEESSQKVLKIGVLYPLSGDIALLGSKALKGLQLAQKEFPSDTMEIIVEDSGGTTGPQLVSSASKLLKIDKVDLIIGPVTIDQALQLAPLAERAGVPIFTHALCSPELLKFKGLVCGYPSSREQLAPLLPLLAKLKVKTLSLVKEQSQYADEVAEILGEKAASGQFSILSQDSVLPKDLDFRTIISKIRKTNPDAVFSTTIDPAQSFAFFKQLKEQGFSGERIGYLDIDKKYLEEFGAAITGIYLPGFIPSNYAASFIKNYEAAYAEAPDMYGAQGFDLFRMITTAILNKKIERKDYISTVIASDYKDPAIPGFKFRTDRSISLPITVLRVEKESFDVFNLD